MISRQLPPPNTSVIYLFLLFLLLLPSPRAALRGLNLQQPPSAPPCPLVHPPPPTIPVPALSLNGSRTLVASLPLSGASCWPCQCLARRPLARLPASSLSPTHSTSRTLVRSVQPRVATSRGRICGTCLCGSTFCPEAVYCIFSVCSLAFHFVVSSV